MTIIVQAPAALVIQPMIPYLTKSEIHAVMTSGFATVTGAIMASIVALGVSIILFLQLPTPRDIKVKS